MFFKVAVLKNFAIFTCARVSFLINLPVYFEEHLGKTASGCRLENHVEIQPQRFTASTCLVYINIPVASSFFIFFTVFLYIFVLVLTKLNLQRESYMENFDWIQNVTSKNQTEFSDCADKYGHVESAD